MSTSYGQEYFTSGIFEYDYAAIASAIMEAYHPSTVIELGCGNGELSKALNKLGVRVVATDGFSTPDLSAYPGIEFHHLDLNDKQAVTRFLAGLGRRFDVGICMEVAEHLDPQVSEALVGWLTGAADTVVFSAAVPEQAGDGHINCRDRLFWHRLFEKQHFFLNDSIRSKIRNNPAVGPWFRLNTVDYVKLTADPDVSRYQRLVENLMLSESTAASMFYRANRQAEHSTQLLNLDLVSMAFRVRNMFKRITGRAVLSKQIKNPS